MIAASPTLPLVVVWVSVGLSAFAAVACLLAARDGLPEMRWAHAGAGVLASIYCGSYIWLGFHFERAADWSQVMRPVGMVSWTIAWASPALISVHIWRRLVKRGKEVEDSL